MQHRSSHNNTQDLIKSGRNDSNRSPFIPPKNLHQQSIGPNMQSTSDEKKMSIQSELDHTRIHNMSTDQQMYN